MDKLKLNNILPFVFSEADLSASEIWLKDIVFNKGLFYLIVAVSGTGKSSLLSYILGERTDYSGIIYYDDKEVDSLRSSEWNIVRKKQLSIVFQNFRLFEDLTVYENIILKNSITNFKSESEISFLLEQSGIDDKIDTKVRYLSLGQQQRLAIIRALCQPFDFLLLDEPFSHLDDDNRELLASLILAEVKKQGAGMIITSLGAEYSFSYNSKLKL